MMTYNNLSVYPIIESADIRAVTVEAFENTNPTRAEAIRKGIVEATHFVFAGEQVVYMGTYDECLQYEKIHANG
jgi:hypothetical protein